MNPFRIVFRHPTATAVAGSAMIGGCILSYKLIPDLAHSPEETVVQDTMMYIGMPLAIVGGGITAVKARRGTTRLFGWLIGTASTLLAILTAATYHDRPR